MRLIILITLLRFTFSQLDGSFWWLSTLNKSSAFEDKNDKNSNGLLTAETVTPLTAQSRSRKDLVCCECVPFYLCSDGVINDSGLGIISARIGGNNTSESSVVNVDICPGEVDICCQVPNADPSCTKGHNRATESSASPESAITPHPQSNCQCTPFNSCHPDLVVSDGFGQTSIELSNGRIVNHSKCLHSLEVCCFLPNFDYIDTLNASSTTVSPISENLIENCECVPSFLCTPDGYINTNGGGLIDVRIGPSKPLPICPHDPKLLCCRLPKSDQVTSPSPIIEPPVTRAPTLCGERNIQGIGVRILGFKEGQTQFGEFPWVGSILKKEILMGEEHFLFVGGASLIHPKVILTAAHKVKKVPLDKLLVRLGDWDTASTKEILPYQDIEVAKVLIHPRFVERTLFHDVALLILKEEAKHQFNIEPICYAQSLNEVANEGCVVNGWGVDAFESGNYQRIMKSVQLPLVEKTKCQELLRKTRLSKYFNLHSSFICAGGQEGVDACKGDGGGPLACPMKNDPTRYLQVGITAWGIGCGTKNVPGVYVDVAEHYSWIKEQIKSLFP